MTNAPRKSALRRFLRNIVRSIRTKRKGKMAVGDIETVASVYNEIFEKNDNYDVLDASNQPKLKYVLRYAKGVNGKVLDAGCGRGSVLRFMCNNSIDAFGIELSAVCFEKYLQDLPAANTDIVSWANKGHTYNGCISTDVMEHIPSDQIDDTLSALAKMSPSVFLGIANHSSVHNGHELHVIQEGIEWWKRKISAHFSRIEVVEPEADDNVLVEHYRNEIFFFVKAEN